MKQKVVFKVVMNNEKSRTKALKIAASLPGVNSVAIRPADQSQMEVTGDGFDAVRLVSLLRKRVGHAEQISIDLIGGKEKQENKKKTGFVCLKGEGDDKSPIEVKSDGIDADRQKERFNYGVSPLFPSLFGFSNNQPEFDFGEKQVRPPEYTLWFESVSLKGDDKKAIEITGDRNDVDLGKRKRVADLEHAEQVSKTEEKKEGKSTVYVREQDNQHEDTSSSPCIQKPELVSIGPYHRDKDLPLNKYKYSFLQNFLSRTRNQGKDLCFYVRQMMTLELRTRRCYSDEDLSMCSSEFVEMMLVDGCFVMEVLHHFGRGKESEDGIFPIEPWQIPILVRDLLLLENQIPFFVLENLFDLSKSEEATATVSVPTMALKFIDLAFPLSMDFIINHLESPKHLLHLLLETIRPSNPSTNSLSLFLKTIHLIAMILSNPISLLLFLNNITRRRVSHLKTPASSKQKGHHLSIQPKPSTSKTADEVKVYLESARELQKSGIEFRPKRADRFTDIHCKDGVLEIPPVTINDLFLAILVNGMAFEQRSTGCSKDLTAYVSFMSSLIRHPTDVELLSSCGIISRFSLENERVASSFTYLQSKISNRGIPQDSYLYMTVMETKCYYIEDRVTRLRYSLPDGGRITRMHYFWRDPKILLFCITSLWFVFSCFKFGY
ncbi:Uncharacterized protein TCM_030240 [Theobroma cacao]|uniref:HMA domain-containing protein n=1 Tax=Theobroma cacao TaxID=3641 RepID=A0A061GGP6_THECC|nr:Uncharacterized protein TCM_030240 [Theobroma cacao]